MASPVDLQARVVMLVIQYDILLDSSVHLWQETEEDPFFKADPF